MCLSSGFTSYRSAIYSGCRENSLRWRGKAPGGQRAPGGDVGGEGGDARAFDARDGGSAPFDASSDDRRVVTPKRRAFGRRRRATETQTSPGTRGCRGWRFERRPRRKTTAIPRSPPRSARFAGSDDSREFRLARSAARKKASRVGPGFGHAPALPVGLLTTREPPRIRDVRTKSMRSTTPLWCARPRGVCAPPAGRTPAKSRGETKKTPSREPSAELVNLGFNFLVGARVSLRRVRLENVGHPRAARARSSPEN